MPPLKQTLIWDLPTRLFHWTLALLVGLQFMTGLLGEDWLSLHALIGYATLTLILFRVLWGFFGGYWSRFSNFIPNHSQVLQFIKSVRSNSQPSVTKPTTRDSPATQPKAIDQKEFQFAGHNPLGALSVLFMLTLLFAQIISGLLSNDDISFEGPFTRWVSNATVEWMTHYHSEVGFYLIPLFVGIHVLAVLYYKFKKTQNLTSAMIHGYKEVEAHIRASTDSFANRFLALALLALSALIIYAILLLA